MLGRSNGARISADRWNVTSGERRSDRRHAAGMRAAHVSRRSAATEHAKSRFTPPLDCVTLQLLSITLAFVFSVSHSNNSSPLKLIALLLLALVALVAGGEFLVGKLMDGATKQKVVATAPTPPAAQSPTDAAQPPSPSQGSGANDHQGGPPWRRHHPNPAPAAP